MNTRPECSIDHTTIETAYCAECGRKKQKTAETGFLEWLEGRVLSARKMEAKYAGAPKGGSYHKRWEMWVMRKQVVETWHEAWKKLNAKGKV